MLSSGVLVWSAIGQPATHQGEAVADTGAPGVWAVGGLHAVKRLLLLVALYFAITLTLIATPTSCPWRMSDHSTTMAHEIV